MSNVILPLLEEPPIKGYQHHAYPLGILFANNDDAYPWLYSNYIQLLYNPNDSCYFNFYSDYFFNWSFFEHQYLSNEILIQNNVNITRFIKNSIKLGYYVYATVNEYYIPQREAYHNRNCIHDILVYGYNEDQNYYNIIGYTDKGNYKGTIVDINEFEKANARCIHLFKKRKDNSYNLDIDLIYEFLNNYLYPVTVKRSYGFSREYAKGCLFGIDACKFLATYIDSIVTKKVKANVIPLYIFGEHKMCMLNRLKYLQQKNIIKFSNYIYDEYKDIECDADILKNLFIKYMLSNDLTLISKMVLKLNSINQREVKVLKVITSLIAKQVK